MPSHNRRGSGVAALAVVLAALLAAGAAGCSSGGHKASGATPAPSVPAAELLASSLKNLQGIGSYTAALTIKTGGVPGAGALGSGGLVLSGGYSAQDAPTQLREFKATTVQAGPLPIGAMDEITTPTDLYINLPALATLMHSSKPWMRIPKSGLKAGTGSGLGQLLNEAQSGDPLSAAKLLAGVRNAKTVGTSTIGGVPVTEISGSEPGTAILPQLPASDRAALAPSVAKIKRISFTEWIDAQRNMRKLVVNKVSSTGTETLGVTMTSTGKPVRISVPPAGQATTVSARALSDLGSSLLGGL